MDVKHVYEDMLLREPRDTVLYPSSNRKDKRTREVPSYWALKLMLSAYQPPASGFLFPSLYRADKHLSRQAMDKAFRRAVKKAGLQNKGFSLYSARRGFITRLNEQGYDIKVIQKLTGPKSINSLIRYIDVTDEQLKNAIANFGFLTMGLVNLNPSNVAVNIAEDIRSSDTVTAVSAGATASVALPANSNRGAYSIYNVGNVTVFMRENATVTATLYKHPIPPGYLFESEFTSSRYTGAISVITSSGTSNLMVSESTIAS